MNKNGKVKSKFYDGTKEKYKKIKMKELAGNVSSALYIEKKIFFLSLLIFLYLFLMWFIIIACHKLVDPTKMKIKNE